MVQAIEVISEFDFVCDIDKDEDGNNKPDATIWKVRALTGMEWMRCTSTGLVNHEMVVNIGLVGWSNFLDSKDGEVEYCIANMSRIPPDILVDLFLKINSASTIGDEERKNS